MLWRRLVVSVAALVVVGGTAFASDPNIEERRPVDDPGNPLTQTITATFPGPLDSFGIGLAIQNGAGVDIDAFELDGSTATAGAILWDSMGSFSGPATVVLAGVDTQVVLMTFTGFEDGETVSFGGVDPDFVDGPAGVTIGELAGCTATVQAGALSGDATFQVVGQDVVATIKLGTISVEPASWARTKDAYR